MTLSPELEVQIALGQLCDTRTMRTLADPTLTCLGCGSVVSQMKTSPLRSGCEVGYAFSARSPADQEESPVDEAVRVALRIVEKRVTLMK